ncbi:MAG: LysM peptidoglycan-binding domain-containing protein [Mongoliibacter sp.]|uniref:LysM peptidoglycan-binding domain-containing protein n=1 Tax=Mongoliibacter sp. TaxID=2022438 RepID=UPI0012F177F2|nr:lytic transglycosylase domain-containing protein [Mongoliibacter sp.]TVP52904.1 MAG: LysM peptidoglycan-binding domain-containing protein [Mongoliibacter sp.]
MRKLTTPQITVLFTSTFILFLAIAASAQIPQVPREMQFADLLVRINEQARREIQLDVDALYRNPSYFRMKAERASLFMPYVEREFRNAGVPEDLKYLVIQESGLISDAVSSSNAVGFWQFKQGTAEEVFLRVDNQVDERKNIVSSSKGAALYLKKHNQSFDNWMCALVSYQMGLGGAKSYFGTQYNGKRVVELDRNSHWYFKKFLAHKVAFEGQLGMLVSNTGFLEEARIQGPTTLKAIAPRLGVTESHLKEYNTWASRGNIPGDKVYSIMYVKEGLPQANPAVIQREVSTQNTQQVQKVVTTASSFPRVTGNTQKANQPDQIQVNNIDGVLAEKNTSQEAFTDRIGMRERRFRRINDLDKDEDVEAGQYYYTRPKKGKAEVEEHVVQPGETLWSISQMYGIKLSSLKSKNRIREDRDLRAGMILNLRQPRKRGEEIPFVPASEYKKIMATSEQPAATAPQNVPANSSTHAPESNNAGQTTGTNFNNSQRIVHTVLQGETLFRLSQKYGVSVDEIRRWNNLTDNTIKVGQRITINKP